MFINKPYAYKHVVSVWVKYILHSVPVSLLCETEQLACYIQWTQNELAYVWLAVGALA